MGSDGDDCSVKVAEVKLCEGGCSGNGECVQGICVCNDGFRGVTCETQYCSNECSHHGTCNSKFECECDAAWTADDCSKIKCPNDCSGNGHCSDYGVCTCDVGYMGLDCGSSTCLNDCSKRGECVKKDNGKFTKLAKLSTHCFLATITIAVPVI